MCRDELVEQKLQELQATQKAFSKALSTSRAPEDVPQEKPELRMTDSSAAPPEGIAESKEAPPEGIAVVGDGNAETPAAKAQPSRILPMSVQAAALKCVKVGGAMPDSSNYSLSSEQQAAVDAALDGRNIFLTGESLIVSPSRHT